MEKDRSHYRYRSPILTEEEKAAKLAEYDLHYPEARVRWENGRILERDPKFWEVVKLQRQYEYLLAKANEKQQEMTVKLNALIAERYLEGGTHE